MSYSKLVPVLKSFTKSDFKGFEKYLNSEFFNHSAKLRKLFSVIRELRMNAEDILANKQTIFRVIYPLEKYSDKKLRHLYSIMLGHIEDYFSLLEYRKYPLENKKNYLKQLYERELPGIFENKLKDYLKDLNKNKIKDEEYYYAKYFVEILKRKFEEKNSFAGKRKDIYTGVLSEIDYITYFYFIKLLKSYLLIQNSNRIVNLEQNHNKLEDLINYLFRLMILDKDVPIAHILHDFLSLYCTKEADNVLENMQVLIENNSKLLSHEDYRNLYIELFNYCKRRQAEGKKGFGEKSFKLLNEMLEKRIFFEDNGFMLDHTYINLVSSALRVNKIDWALNFINKYKMKIYPNKDESAYNYSFAMYNYITGKKNAKIRKNNYGIALEYLLKVTGKDFYYLTRIKNLLLIIYYELNDKYYFESILDSYRHDIKNHLEIPEHLKNRYLCFINYTHKLFTLSRKSDYFSIKKLKRKIVNESEIEYKGWLLECIKDLLSKEK